MRHAFGATNRGLVREKNEDSIYLNQETGLFACADGMGGHSLGAYASETSIAVVTDFILKNLPSVGQDDTTILSMLRAAFARANDEIYWYSQAFTNQCIIGTTLSVTLFVNNKLFIGHVGDSRIYRLHRNGVVEKLTCDHNQAQELVDAGLLTASEAENHKQSHILTRAMGVAETINPDFFAYEVLPGDRFLLSTDGLFRVVPVDMAVKQLGKGKSPEKVCTTLLMMALERGAPDNTSLIIITEPPQKGFFKRIFSRS